jgi:DNA invertase Pin-like site-specific DNA recombinase
MKSARKLNELAENLIFTYMVDAGCDDSTEFDTAIGILFTSVKNAQYKLYRARQKELFIQPIKGNESD